MFSFINALLFTIGYILEINILILILKNRRRARYKYIVDATKIVSLFGNRVKQFEWKPTKKVAKSKIKNILTMKLEAKAEHILNGWMFFLCENAVLVIFLKY